MSLTEYQKEFRKLGGEAIAKKLKDKYKGQWLLVVLEGALGLELLRGERDRATAEGIFKELVAERREALANIYGKVLLCGIQNGVLFQQDLST